jgi:hypothetical protein
MESSDEAGYWSMLDSIHQQIEDSRNFWKWLALASWIFIGLTAILTLLPIR